jgi:hypothetical protein
MFTSGAPVSDNTGSKCKIICRIKISAKAGMTPFMKTVVYGQTLIRC